MKNRYKVKSLKPHKLGYSIDGARVFPIILNMDNSNVFTTDIVFKQYDYGTCTINAQIVKKEDVPVDITNLSIISIFKIANKTVVGSGTDRNDVEVVDQSNGLIKISIPNTVLKRVGEVECEIVLFDEENNRTTSPRFLFKINESIYNHEDSNVELPQDENYPLLIGMINEIKNLKNEMSEFLTVVQATNSEMENNETSRQSQESQRQEQETQRQESINTAMEAIDNKIKEIIGEKDVMVISVGAKVEELVNAKETMVNKVNDTLSTVETRVNNIIASGTVDLEVKDSRFNQEGVEYSCLKERLISIENTPQIIFETIEG